MASVSPANPASYYQTAGSKRLRPLSDLDERLRRRIEKAERDCKKMKSSPTAHVARLTSKSYLQLPKTWQFFSRQQVAIERARCSQKDVHVFSFEADWLGQEGQRRFVVASYLNFYQKYIKIRKLERHFYEVITDGSVCRLYFDLEYSVKLNPHKNGDAMVDTFVEVVCHFLSQEYNISCQRKNVLDLTSSTDVKFSRHLIFDLPGCCFRSNMEVGAFVHYVHNVVSKHIGNKTPLNSSLSGERLETLYVRTDKGTLTYFCDLGVYTRNRNFRLLGSRKLGKTAYLRLAKANCFPLKHGDAYLAARRQGDLSAARQVVSFCTFMSSLVCNVSYQHAGNMRVLTFTDHLAKPSVSSYLNSRAPSLEGNVSTIGVSAKSPQPKEGSRSNSGFSCSPFPDIDAFICSVVSKRGSLRGGIRQWVYFPEGKTLVYDISNNRWCENIGRAHKSNHIMFVVHLQDGVYYQKCYDTECRQANYRSPARSLPEDLKPEGQDVSVVALNEDELLMIAAMLDVAEASEDFFGPDVELDKSVAEEHSDSDEGSWLEDSDVLELVDACLNASQIECMPDEESDGGGVEKHAGKESDGDGDGNGGEEHAGVADAVQAATTQLKTQSGHVEETSVCEQANCPGEVSQECDDRGHQMWTDGENQVAVDLTDKAASVYFAKKNNLFQTVAASDKSH